MKLTKLSVFHCVIVESTQYDCAPHFMHKSRALTIYNRDMFVTKLLDLMKFEVDPLGLP